MIGFPDSRLRSDYISHMNTSDKIALPLGSTDAIAQTVSGLFSTLADAMPQMVWATDADGSHFYFNRRWYEYTGLSEAQSMGFGFANVLYPDDIERTLMAWRAAWERNANYEIEYRFRRYDGTYRWFVARATPVRDSTTGAVTMWIGTCTDIDDTRAALDDLRESQSRLSVAVDAARLGMWDFDLATQSIAGSARTRELFGITDDRPFSLDKWAELIHEEDRGRVVEVFFAYVTAPAWTDSDRNTRYLAHYRVRRADNTVRYLSVMGTRVYEGGVATRLVGTVQDSTEQYNTLAALHESADALRESEARFRSVVSNAPIIVYAIDRNGVFTFSDGKGLSAIGLASGEAVGRTVEEMYADNPELIGYIRRALGGEEIFWTATVNGLTFETQCTPLYGSGYTVEGIIGVAYDVTERNRAEAASRESEERFRLATQSARLGVWEFSGPMDRVAEWFSKTGVGSVRFDAAFAQIYDINPDAMQVEPISARIHPEDRERALYNAGVVFAPSAVSTYYTDEYRLLLSDGISERWIRSTGQLFIDKGTNFGRFVGTAQDVTEQREAQRLLHESENRFRSLVEASSQIILRGDAQGRVHVPSPGFEAFTGMTFEEYEGFKGNEAVHPDDQDGIARVWQRSFAARESLVLTYRLRHRSGQFRWVEYAGTPVRGKDALVSEWVGTILDIHDRKTAEEELARSEARYRTLTEVLPQSIWAADADGAITYCNRYWYNYTGFTEAQTMGAGWVNAMHPDDVAKVADDWQTALDTGNDYETETRLKRGWDNAYRTFLVRGRASRDSDNGTVTQWLGTAIDIHDRKVAEQALHDEEARFRDLADNIAQLAWMTDATGYIFWYNRRWFDYTGTTFDAMQGWGWQKVHHPDFVEAVTQKFAGHIERGEAWEDTFPLRGADGNYRWFLSRAFPIRDESGTVLRWFGTNTDITTERDASLAVRRSEERFRSLVTATAQIVWSTGPSGEFVTEQKAWAQFTGQTWSEYERLGWLNAVYADDREATTRAWRTCIRTHTALQIEHRLCRADGSYRYMSVRAVPIREADNTVREWIGVHTDITEQKEAERALSAYAKQQAHVAEVLQRSLLNTPPRNAFPGITISTHYEPALDEAQVGGDFFDVFALDAGRVAFVVGDVTGKGLKAAEHTGQLKYALRAFLRETPDPGDALPRVNKLLTDAQRLDPAGEGTNAMAAVTVAVIDTTTGDVSIAGGGAESPLHYVAASGRCEELRTFGVVVGAYPDSVYEVARHRLAPGDLLLIGTDGITEVRKSRREFFGAEGFAAAVEAVAPRANTLEAISQHVIEAAKAFSANQTFRDDVCLLIVRRDG